MFAILSNFFQKNRIILYAPVPLSACKIKKPYLLERAGIPTTGTVLLFAVPYLSPACENREKNVSAYAAPRDYHAYFSTLFDELLPTLRAAFPDESFAGWADHSPIDEVDAAARASLGVIGENGLLITERYSSFVFLGGIYTSASLSAHTDEPRRCTGCGACKRACPTDCNGVCLSSLTQKKGALSTEEQRLLIANGSAWGCDVCQEVCPYTHAARNNGTLYTDVPYFLTHTIPTLSLERLAAMTEEELSARAYAWRGRETIERNLRLIEKGEPLC